MKVCFITATRAEYGLLYPVIKEMNKDSFFQIDIVVSGTHLLYEYGCTKNEIYKDDLGNIYEIDIICEQSNTSNNTSRIMANAIDKFSKYLDIHKPDLAIILGDRYEMLAFSTALINEHIPIAHLNGGEITEGVLDDMYRHCITKMSVLHFTNCEQHRKRVIQLGENPNFVFNVGDTCIDNIVNTQLYTKEELEEKIGITLPNSNIITTTFHPITLENDSLQQLDNLLNATLSFPDYFFVFTKANADYKGIQLNERLYSFINDHPTNNILVPSLGRVGYLSMLHLSCAVLGNSSSGLYEVPYFKIPTINIGNRQKNRLHGRTVIDCNSDTNSIIKALKYALSADFHKICESEQNIWGNGDAALKIVQIVKEYYIKGLSIKKTFYDLPEF